jgi:hypothetical protein
MKPNVGGVDRVLRITVGLVSIALVLAGTVGAWGWIGLFLLATGLTRVCPAYSMVGVDTSGK